MRTLIISSLFLFVSLSTLLSQSAITSVAIEEVKSYTKKIDNNDVSVEMPYYSRYFKSDILEAEYDEWTFQWYVDNVEASTEVVLLTKFAKKDTYEIGLTVTNKVSGASITATPISVETLQDYQIPNVITPNGDGKNDEIVIINGDNADMILTVYDKSGTLVYKSQGIEIYWKGLDNNGEELPSNIYYYVLETAGVSDVKKSFIYLYR